MREHDMCACYLCSRPSEFVYEYFTVPGAATYACEEHIEPFRSFAGEVKESWLNVDDWNAE